MIAENVHYARFLACHEGRVGWCSDATLRSRRRNPGAWLSGKLELIGKNQQPSHARRPWRKLYYRSRVWPQSPVATYGDVPLDLFEAIVLGIVQGLTEFLPISSSAHLRIVPALLGWHDPGAAFTAVIQIGTLVAVLAYFRRDIARIGRAWLDATSLAASRPRRSTPGWAG